MQQSMAVMAPLKPIHSNDQEVIEALDHLEETFTNVKDLRASLSKLHHDDFSLLPATRMLKVHTHLRIHKRSLTSSIPEIILRGNWLQKAGFSCDDQWVHVITMNEMIVITPQIKSRNDELPV